MKLGVMRHSPWRLTRLCFLFFSFFSFFFRIPTLDSKLQSTQEKVGFAAVFKILCLRDSNHRLEKNLKLASFSFVVKTW